MSAPDPAPPADPGAAPGAAATPGPSPAPGPRRIVGPFTARQLGSVVLSAGLAAAVLSLANVPIAPGPATATPFPEATAYIVGEAVEGLRPGELAPELAVLAGDATAPLRDLDGEPVSLADLRGKLVWLNFWASWCPPCQAETPVLRAMDEAYRDRGLAIVAVAVQETTPEIVRAYAERYQLAYRIGFDAGADVFRTYRVFALPTQFFVAADGRILEVVNGPLDEAAAAARIEAWLPRP